MPDIVMDIFMLLAALVRFLGLAAFGLGFGWLALDMLKKTQQWYVQITVFLGIAGLLIAMSCFSGIAAVGALSAGLGVAFLIWGLPKKEKKED